MRIGMSWLDVKLGLRMLIRYPGLALAGGFGIAVVVVCGTAAAVFDAVVNGTLPFEDGDRVVAIENWDTGANSPEPRALHDFVVWRDALTAIDDIGAYRLTTHNVGTVDLGAGSSRTVRAPEPARIAEISAAAFRVARVPPLAGRALVDADELEGALPVVVIGESESQRLFAGTASAIGRLLHIGDTTFTIVGIMPDRFGFPVNERYWIPLRLRPSDYARGQGPALSIFGRLAAGADTAAAQAEVTLVGQHAAAASPDTHARLRARVLPYTQWFFSEMHDGETTLFRIIIGLLLGVVGANVAVLVYARTATRRVEIALRSALGASRRRIVGQMFVEGLALSAAAAAGLALAAITRAQLTLLTEQAPFWVDTSVTSGTVISYVLVLAALGAVIVGVIPALQATGRRAQTGMQQAAAGLSSWKIGRTYAALIIVQVALAVAILPAAVSTGWAAVRQATLHPGFPANEFLTARLGLNTDTAAAGEADVRFRDRQSELARRLASEPGVSHVTFLTSVPGSEPNARIEVEGGTSRREVGIGRIGLDFFDVFEVPILAGRPFDGRDLDTASRQVIVNRTFAEQVAGGDALGRRVRHAGSGDAGPGPWLEIVGVVSDLPAAPADATIAEARLYYPAGRDVAPSAFATLPPPPFESQRGETLLALRVRGAAPSTLASPLRAIAATLDRSLLLDDISTMDAVLWEQQFEARLAAWVTGLITLSVLLLSATGLYALMAFTVTQRRKEIGIRVALGADPRRVLGRILSRSFWQLAAGIVIGVALAALVDTATEGELTGGAGLPLLPAVATFVLFVGLAAAAGPARRGLRIQPTVALRED